MRSLALAAVSALAMAGCGGGAIAADGGVADAAGDAAIPSGDAGPSAARPIIPWLVDGAPEIAMPAAPSWACPAGWARVELGPGLATCEPFPGETRADCAADELLVPGASRCTPVGSECPAGGWPPDEGAAIHVRPGAIDGDGSRERPFASIDAALAVAADGARIALSTGRHETVGIEPTRSVEIVGACASATVLAPTLDASTSDALVRATHAGASVRIRDVALTPEGRPGATARAGGSLELTRVTVRGAAQVAVEALGAGTTVTLAEVLLRDVALVGGTGHGVRANGGAVVAADRVAIEGAAALGVSAWSTGTRVTLRDVAVSRTGGQGVQAMVGAAIVGARVAVEETGGLGAGAIGAALSLDDFVVRRISAATSTGRGSGITSSGLGARLALHRGLVESTADLGVSLADVSVVEDLVVRDVLSSLPGEPAVGIGATGNDVTIRRVVVSDVQGIGITTAAAAAAIEDASVDRVGSPDDPDRGAGIEVSGGRASLDRVRVGDAEGYAVSVSSFDATSVSAEARDVTIAEANGGIAVVGGGLVVERARLSALRVAGLYASQATVRASDVLLDAAAGAIGSPTFGIAVVARDGSEVELSRVWARAQRSGAAIVSGAGTHMSATDLVVSDPSGDAEGALGRGIEVDSGASATLSRALVIGAREIALLALHPGSRIEASDLVVERTRERACAEAASPGPCADTPGGTAVGSYTGARVFLSRFEIVDAPLCGIQIADGGEADAASGLVGGCTIGLCLQVPAFDPERITRTVRFEGNVRNVDSTELPVPTPPPTPEIRGSAP